MKHYHKILGCAVAGLIAAILCGCGSEPDVSSLKRLEADTQASEEDSETEESTEENSIVKLKTFPVGTYTNPDGDKFVIADNGDGTYTAEISLLRLATFESTTGAIDNGKLLISAEDPAGGLGKMCIYKTKGGEFTLEFTDINWAYISSGDMFEHFSKSTDEDL